MSDPLTSPSTFTAEAVETAGVPEILDPPGATTVSLGVEVGGRYEGARFDELPGGFVHEVLDRCEELRESAEKRGGESIDQKLSYFLNTSILHRAWLKEKGMDPDPSMTTMQFGDDSIRGRQFQSLFTPKNRFEEVLVANPKHARTLRRLRKWREEWIREHDGDGEIVVPRTPVSKVGCGSGSGSGSPALYRVEQSYSRGGSGQSPSPTQRRKRMISAAEVRKRANDSARARAEESVRKLQLEGQKTLLMFMPRSNVSKTASQDKGPDAPLTPTKEPLRLKDVNHAPRKLQQDQGIKRTMAVAKGSQSSQESSPSRGAKRRRVEREE